MREILKVNMSCKHCENAIESELKTIPNVISYEIKLDKKQVVVDYNGDLDIIIKGIESIGYTVEKN